VVVAAGAIESARLFLQSATVEEPEGIGNAHGLVGRFLQGHVYTGAYGLFTDPVQDGLGPGVSVATRRLQHGNPDVIGGGMLANEFVRLPILHWYRALPPEAPRWGAAAKRLMRDGYGRTGHVQGPVQEIPSPASRVRLSPTMRDRAGIPVAMLSGSVHPETLRTAGFLRARAAQWLEAAGASRVWETPLFAGLSAGQHQAGTLRMAADPRDGVTAPDGRVHGYDNLWVADASLHVTNGGVNPVLTVYALACRTAVLLTESG
jgi:choline dehydrogenase-like flavoprotein